MSTPEKVKVKLGCVPLKEDRKRADKEGGRGAEVFLKRGPRNRAACETRECVFSVDD